MKPEPDVYVARPKPFTPAEHKERRKEELRAAITNLEKEQAFVVKRIEAAKFELARLEK